MARERYKHVETKKSTYSCCACGNKVEESNYGWGDGRVSCSLKCTEKMKAGPDGKGGWLCLTHPSK